ncbi:MAG: prephenate dehydratase [Gammaproteobacteria bacterium]|nr:prephenate dehydratase [Gammaproteobacteria bacterium]NNF61914.1 prephenate dehydratase [Gammaproteobacteria bacterium]NNM19782.1 prephenate dehydratase [Gammaproteobacteria bacterium]
MSDNEKTPALEAIRNKIDELDTRIQELISERARIAKHAGLTKGSGRKTVDYYRPEREAQILRRVIDRNDGPLRDEEMVRLFREVMSACLAQQEPLKVAFLGPEGTFTQAAVLKHFGHSVRALSLATIEEVFHEVEGGVADFGVVPVENSTEGTVTNTLDMFVTSPLNICGEVELRIRQHLLSNVDDICKIQKVYSHRHSLAQCRSWLDEYLPGIERIAVSSNAEGARRAKDEAGAAAVAGDAAAEVYGLECLVSNIEDRPDNTTRFLVIGRDLFPPSGHDKTSLLMSAGHTPGSLQQLLYPMATHDINMTRIESRPSRRQKWDYVFFVDVEGHADDEKVAAALAELEKVTSLFRVLGSYPSAVV